MRVPGPLVFDVVKQSDASQGKIAPAARELDKRPATIGIPGRKSHFDNQFVRLEHRRECAGKEISSWDDALSLSTGDNDLCLASYCDTGHFRRGIRVGEA